MKGFTMRKLLTFGIVLLAIAGASVSSFGGSMMLMGVGKPRPAAATPTLTYIGNSLGPSYSNPTYTFTGASIGPTAGFTTRRIIATVFASNQYQPLTNVKINGVSATIHVAAWANSTGNDPGCAIASLPLAAGTTANIEVTYGGLAFTPPGIGIYTVDDALLVSTAPSTPAGSAIATSSVSNITTSSFTEAVGGFTIACTSLETSGNTALAMTSPGYSPDDFGGTNRALLASKTSISSAGSATAASSWATITNTAAAVAASWR